MRGRGPSPARLDQAVSVYFEFRPHTAPQRIQHHPQALAACELHGGYEVGVSRYQHDEGHQPLECERRYVKTDAKLAREGGRRKRAFASPVQKAVRPQSSLRSVRNSGATRPGATARCRRRPLIGLPHAGIVDAVRVEVGIGVDQVHGPVGDVIAHHVETVPEVQGVRGHVGAPVAGVPPP